MRPTLFQQLAVWVVAVPPLVALLNYRHLSRGARWIAVWCALLTIATALSLFLASRNINNHWIRYVFEPASVAIVLWALSHWQPDSTSRMALRFAVPLVLLVSAVLVLTLENRRTFSLVASPFQNMVLLFAALWTFIALSLHSALPLLRQDWFWISAGLMLFAASSIAIGPLAWYFLRPRLDLLHAMLNVQAGASTVAFAAITWGMLCQRQPEFSGGSFSPHSWRSSSSSEDSR